MTTCMLLSFSTTNSHTSSSMTTNTPNSHTSRSMMNDTPSSHLTTALTSLYQSIDDCETWQPSLYLESRHFTMEFTSQDKPTNHLQLIVEHELKNDSRLSMKSDHVKALVDFVSQIGSIMSTAATPHNLKKGFWQME